MIQLRQLGLSAFTLLILCSASSGMAGESLFTLSSNSAPSILESEPGDRWLSTIQLDRNAATLQADVDYQLSLPDQAVTLRLRRQFTDGDHQYQVLTNPQQKATAIVESQSGLVQRIRVHLDSDQQIFLAESADGQSGQLFAQDPEYQLCVAFPNAPAQAPDLAMSQVASAPLYNVDTLRTLHSRPESKNVILLDFWGGQVVGTAWNDSYNNGQPIDYLPFSDDADTTTFSDYEKRIIWLAWREVVEDFSPFDVNITTDRSLFDSTPAYQRALAIITTTDEWFSSDAGGVAYPHAWGSWSDYFSGAWVWNHSAGSIGMTISHELGHNLGLYHDGNATSAYYSGHGKWGPIMGAPFNREYVQWARGGYPGANNGQDDIAIISNKLGVTADESDQIEADRQHRGAITPSGATNAIDIDRYQLVVEHAGEVAITVMPLLAEAAEKFGTNLSMRVRLLDHTGSQIAEHQTTQNASDNRLDFSVNLTAGEYEIEISAESYNSNWSTYGFDNYGNGGYYLVKVSQPEISDDSAFSKTLQPILFYD
ncbi:zinc-dependent metalloprotease family protein [Gammaproteobacteria bacterium]|nr:zinc-dependent metalloprotease family protein [Gammaproteobacteria bacterium]